MTTWSVTGSFKGLPLTLLADSAYGGAITSVQWSGWEFLSQSIDHGGQWQTALEYDGLGEALNPTEAGSAYDTATTSSAMFGFSASPNELFSLTQMAYWLPVNGQFLSDTGVSKTVEVGWRGIPNLIHEHVTVFTLHDYQNGGLEIVTQYLPPSMHWVVSLDPKTAHYSDLHWNGASPNFAWTNNNGHDAIVAGADNGLSIAIWSPDSGGQYAANYLDNQYHPSMKIDAWASWDHPGPGHPAVHDVYVAIGTLEDVAQAIHSAWAMLNPV